MNCQGRNRRSGMGPSVADFDDWADGQLERLRGNRFTDLVFVNASHLGDFSVIWHLIGAARGITDDRRTDQAFALSGALGVESLIVNQGIKRLFRRRRPTVAGDGRYEIRRPVTSSFPSGHASSAFMAATVLTAFSGRRTAPAWFSLATIVGVSRAYVRIHHPSDVVAGALVGLALGCLAERVLAKLT